jgi:DNA-binding NarL/FixJ family response regulator
MLPYRIALAEDHTLIREAVKKSIEEVPDWQVVGEFSDGRSLLNFIQEESSVPDMLILDITMPNLQGIEATKLIKRLYPEIKILILTMHNTARHIKSAIGAGADGYLLKENALADLISAIETIRAGNCYFSRLITDQIVDDLFSPETKIKPLGKRETEVLTLLAQGKSSERIAQILSISVTTVRNHRMNIKRKLHIKNTFDLIKYALKQGYVTYEYE